MKQISAALVFALTLLTACADDATVPAPHANGSHNDDDKSDTEAPSTSSSSKGSSKGEASDDDAVTTTKLSGKIAGKSFAPKSGFFFKFDDGGADVILSDRPDACAAAQRHEVQPGETLVLLFNLAKDTKGSAGAMTTQTAKFERIAESCGGGGDAYEQLQSTSKASSDAKIELSTLGETSADVTLDLDFEDGSKLAGTFTLEACPTTFDGPVCP